MPIKLNSKANFVIYLYFIFISSTVFALIPLREKTEPSLTFFRSPYSAFPSGVADLTILNSTKKQIKSEIWYFVESQFQTKWVPASDLVFIDLNPITSVDNQFGFVKETTPTLRLNSGWRNGSPIPEGTKVTITSIRSDWSCGFDEAKKPVCVSSNKVILPIDAALKIKTISGQWHDIKARKKHLFVTTKNTFIPISKVLEWKPDTHVAFLRSSLPENSFNLLKNDFHSPYLKVVIKEKEVRKWNQSLLENHGPIWWQEPNLKKANEAPIIITTEELQSRTIFSKATPTLSKNLSLVSANGIFISKDNSSWKHLSQFGEDNHPVAIGPKNTLIVGDQISFNEGKTFQNYLRWDQIALQAQTSLNHPPQHLKLHTINFVAPNSLEIQIETGYKMLIFKFNTVNNIISLQNSRLVR